MNMRVTFSDGSSEQVIWNQDRHEIAQHWRQLMKYHSGTAQPVAFAGEYAVYPYDRRPYSQRTGYHLKIRNYNDFDGDMHYNYVKYYKTLGRALAALERLGDGTKRFVKEN